VIERITVVKFRMDNGTETVNKANFESYNKYCGYFLSLGTVLYTIPVETRRRHCRKSVRLLKIICSTRLPCNINECRSFSRLGLMVMTPVHVDERSRLHSIYLEMEASRLGRHLPEHVWTITSVRNL